MTREPTQSELLQSVILKLLSLVTFGMSLWWFVQNDYQRATFFMIVQLSFEYSATQRRYPQCDPPSTGKP